METTIPRLVLAGYFLYAALGKAKADESGQVVRDYDLPAWSATVIKFLWILEAVLAILLPFASTAWVASLVALLFLLAATSLVVRSLARGKKHSCHCSGPGSGEIGVRTLLQNGVLMALAVIVLVYEDPAMPGLWQLDQDDLAQWAVIALLLSQRGSHHLRLKKVESILRPMGSDAPDFRLKQVDGSMVGLADLQAAGKLVLLIFASPRCSICQTVLPRLAELKDADVTMAVITRGAASDNMKYDFEHVLLDSGDEVTAAYGVVDYPTVVMVRDGKIISDRITEPEITKLMIPEVRARFGVSEAA